MNVSVAPLDLRDPALLDELVALQRTAYAVEAELIGAPGLPPMAETPEELRACGETFLGAREDGTLLGAVAYKRDGGTVDIHRLVVAPSAFRRGVATRLLDALEAHEPHATHWTVGTGKGNAAALALYEGRGFAPVEEREVPGGITWVRMDRTGAPRAGRPGAGRRLAGAPRAGRARPWRLLAAACLALAALSLLLPSVPTYDPWAWIIWGREIVHLDLVTTDGPSWKPLPVLFTAPFSLLGDGAAPTLWILVARAGGLLALAMAFRLAARLAGPVAGAIAAVALLLSDEFVRNFARGNSEGLLVALCLWALERHLDGRRRDAFLLGFAAGLLRPEIWPLWGLYGLWLAYGAWRESRRVPWRELFVLAGTGLLLLLLWFLPEYLGSGSALRAAARARQPNPDSAAFAAFPFAEVFRRASYLLTLPVYAGAVIAVAGAWLRRRETHGRVILLLAGVSTVLMVAVALMTQGGFAGNLRYVSLPAAVVCVLAGVGWVDAVRAADGRLGRAPAVVLAAAAVAFAAPYVVSDAKALRQALQRVGEEADLYGADLREVIAGAGGERAVKACGPVFTGPFQTQALTWYLHLHETDVSIFPAAPGTVVAPLYTSYARDSRFPEVARTQRWMAGRTCRTR